MVGLLIYIATHFELLLIYKSTDRGKKMTDEKSKQLNVRVTAELYDRLKQEADKQEITLAECVRNLLDRDIQSDNKGDHTRYIEQLEKQIEYLQNEMQNERKNNTELMKLLDQQQQLTLTNNKRIELLETEIEAKEPKENAGWFKRLFSK